MNPREQQDLAIFIVTNTRNGKLLQVETRGKNQA